MSRQTDNNALPSPCISVCQLDPVSGQCIGCFRTGAEIAAWRSMTPGDQRELLDAIRDRRAATTGVERRLTRRRRG